LLPVALQTMNAINSYLKAATALGLERRSKPVPSLDEYLAQTYTPPAAGEALEAPEAQPDAPEGSTTEEGEK
jgi:hypothetical protein